MHLSTRQVRENGFLCSLCCSLISADNGGPVARGKAPFLCRFLDIEISKFRKDLLLIFFCHKLNLISGENSPLKEMLSLHRNHLFYSICNCQHSIERKILLSKVHRTTFLNTLKSSLPSKKWTLGFCRILKGSYSKKDWQNTELSHFLLERLKHHKDH